MTKLEQFFFDNAGGSWNPQIETQEQGKMRAAAELAKAMHYALDQGWSFDWADDDQPCNCGESQCSHTVECCRLLSHDDVDAVLASLSGICGPTGDYRRVVEAELAMEAMHTLEAK